MNTEEEIAAAAPAPPKRLKMRFKHKLMLYLVCLGLMAVLRTGFLFVIMALLPTIVAYYTDTSKERYAFKTIFAMNLAGLLPSLGRMLRVGASSALLQSTMGDATNWLMIYGAAMVGWLLVEICPMIAQVLIIGLHQTQIGRLEKVKKKIETEWGAEVMQVASERGE